MKNILKKGDIYIIVVLLIIGGIGLFIFEKFIKKDGCKVMIFVDGEIYAEYNIADNVRDQIIIDNNINVLVIGNKEVYIEDANCRDKICVNHNAISKSGETIICLPHKLVVEIQGESELEYDIH